jgi:hypothetical protein
MSVFLRSVRVWANAAVAMMLGLMTTAEPAGAQGVTVESLRGRSIEASVNYQQRVRREGRGEFDAPLTVDYRLNIGGDGRVTGSVTRSSTGPRGPVSASRQINAVLGRPGEIRGSGHAVMILSGNTLTMLRTFEVGGVKTTITFAGGGCSIRSPVMREVGAGPTRRDSMVGGSIEVLSSRQVSTRCQVTR